MEQLKRTLAFCEKDPLFYVDVAECARHGRAVIEYADTDGVLLYEKESGIYAFACDGVEAGKKILRSFSQTGERWVVAHGEAARAACYDSFFVLKETKCRQIAYRGAPFVLSDVLDFRPVGDRETQAIKEVYALEPPENIDALRKKGLLYAAYTKENEFVGFIGSHLEGSMGLLYIYPAHRRHGYAELTEKFLANKYLSEGKIPYGHVIEGNEASLALQMKMGFEKANEFIYWLRKKR